MGLDGHLCLCHVLEFLDVFIFFGGVVVVDKKD